MTPAASVAMTNGLRPMLGRSVTSWLLRVVAMWAEPVSSSVFSGRDLDRLRGRAGRELEVHLRQLSGGQDDSRARAGAKARRGGGHGVGAGVERRKGVGARAVRGGGALEVGARLLGGDGGTGNLGTGGVGDLALDAAEITLGGGGKRKSEGRQWAQGQGGGRYGACVPLGEKAERCGASENVY